MGAENPILEALKNTPIPPGASIPTGLISADSHVTEPPHCYTKYIDPKFRDRAPKVAEGDDGGDGFIVEGMPGTIPVGIIAAAGKDPRHIKKGETKFADLHPGGWDGAARAKEQDLDGIAAEVIYPSVGMVICNHPDGDFKNACMWAYNRWLAEEFVAANPKRLIGMGQTAIRSVDEAIQDFRKFKEMGFKGVMMPGNPATEEDYDSPIFDPLWETAVDLNLPLSFHILTSRSDGANSIGSSGERRSAHRGPPQNASQALVKSIQDIIGLFVWGRVFERHPKLKLVCVEADAGWLPHFAYRMDHGYNRHRFWMKFGDMKKTPSEYIFENVYLTFQDDWTAFKMVDMVNPNRLMWANDFPHSDSTWPWSRDLLLRQTASLKEDVKLRILRDNAAELYGVAQ